MRENNYTSKEILEKVQIQKKLGERLTEIMEGKNYSTAMLASQLYKSLNLSKNGAKQTISFFRKGVFKNIGNTDKKLTRIFVALEIKKDDELITYTKKLYPDYEYPPTYDIFSIGGLSLYDKLNFLDKRELSVIEKAVENELHGEKQDLTLFEQMKYITHENFENMEEEVTFFIEEKREN